MREATTTTRWTTSAFQDHCGGNSKSTCPKENKTNKRGGRPRVSDRAVANAIWYVLWTGCQWKAIHREWFGVSSSVVHERFQRWRQRGLFEKL